MNQQGLTKINIILMVILVGIVSAEGYLFWLRSASINSTAVPAPSADSPKLMPKTLTQVETPATTSGASNVAPSGTQCNNLQCLAIAASKCEPTSAVISAQATFPLNPNMSESAQTKYEINQTSSTDACVLTISTLAATVSISDAGRQAALKQGMTTDQIDAQLQAINQGLKEAANIKTVCQSTADIIADYLTDLTHGNVDMQTHGSVSGQPTTTYTTSAGKKLVCIEIAE